MADITVDPSQVQSISVDPSEVTPISAPSATTGQAASADTTFAQRVSDPSKTYDNLTGGSGVFNNATKAGVASVIQGVGQGVSGLYNTVRHPLDTVRGLASIPGQAAQVPDAIKDINASADPVGTYAKVAGQTAGQAGGQALVAAAAPAVLKGAGKAVASVRALRDIPAAISSDTIDTLNNVAQKEGLPAVTATTARDAIDQLQKSFFSRAKASYGVVDAAVDGDLKPVQQQIRSLGKSIAANEKVNPELAAKQSIELAKQQSTLSDLVQKAKANGVPNAEELMKSGDADYARSGEGWAGKKVASGIKTPSGLARMGGDPHPGGFASQIDRLERTGVLQRALGQEATDQLVQNAKAGLARSKTLATVSSATKEAGKGIAKGLGIGAGGAAGYGVYKALSGK